MLFFLALASIWPNNHIFFRTIYIMIKHMNLSKLKAWQNEHRLQDTWNIAAGNQVSKKVHTLQEIDQLSIKYSHLELKIRHLKSINWIVLSPKQPDKAHPVKPSKTTPKKKKALPKSRNHNPTKRHSNRKKSSPNRLLPFMSFIILSTLGGMMAYQLLKTSNDSQTEKPQDKTPILDEHDNTRSNTSIELLESQLEFEF